MHFDGGLKLSIAQHSSAGQKSVNEDSLGKGCSMHFEKER